MENGSVQSSDGPSPAPTIIHLAPSRAFQDSIPLVADNTVHPDSGYRSYAESVTSTAQLGSLWSDAANHCFENGRRYHGWRQGRYPHPNDEKESDREDMKHHAMMLQTGGRLFLSPMTSNPERVLDLGTGTGIWAIQFAEKYPSVEVIGVDLSPIQPVGVPPNLQFEVDDIESPWTYGSNKFDYIHIRYMFAGTRDWPQLLAECMHALKPGGYVELIEMDARPTSDDNSIPSDYKLEDFLRILRHSAREMGFDLDVARKFAGLLETAGFVDITEEKLKLPMGPWAQDPLQKEVGLYQREQFLGGLPAIGNYYLTKVEGWSMPEVTAFFTEIENQILDDSIHCYWKTYFVYGQKPVL